MYDLQNIQEHHVLGLIAPCRRRGDLRCHSAIGLSVCLWTPAPWKQISRQIAKCNFCFRKQNNPYFFFYIVQHFWVFHTILSTFHTPHGLFFFIKTKNYPCHQVHLQVQVPQCAPLSLSLLVLHPAVGEARQDTMWSTNLQTVILRTKTKFKTK